MSTRKQLYSDEFYKLVFANFPTSDKHGKNNEYYIHLEVIKGQYDSVNIAEELEKTIKGNFYYRDYTKDGLPFVEEGNIYWSEFWFQYKNDAINFVNSYKGVCKGNWEEGYEKFMLDCNRKRNNDYKS